MVIKRMILLITGCFFLAGCNMGMNDVLGRTTKDPFTEIPKVQSFNGDFSNIINWKHDEAADEYYLYRAPDDLNPYYELIYSGFLTEYRDVFTLSDENKRFLYRLGKRRGEKLFLNLNTRGKAELGAAHNARRDFHEPNDDSKHATVLDLIKLEANSWLYGSNTIDNIIIYDEDWYRVEIPAKWTAGIKLVEVGTGTNVDHFNIEILGSGSSRKVISNEIIPIVNNENHADWFYFRIYPDFSVFRIEYQDQGLMGGYGTFISYTIEVSWRMQNSN